MRGVAGGDGVGAGKEELAERGRGKQPEDGVAEEEVHLDGVGDVLREAGLHAAVQAAHARVLDGVLQEPERLGQRDVPLRGLSRLRALRALGVLRCLRALRRLHRSHSLQVLVGLRRLGGLRGLSSLGSGLRTDDSVGVDGVHVGDHVGGVHRRRQLQRRDGRRRR